MALRGETLAGVAATAVAWMVIWAIPGGVIEAVDNISPAAHGFTRQVDMWPQTLGLPGLVAGVLFSALVLVTGGRRSLTDLALARSASWGALSGVLVGALVVWGVAPGLADSWPLAGAVLAAATSMGAVAGALTPILFGSLERWRAREGVSQAGR